MSDERATFEQTKARLEDILVQVRKKDTSLEQSLDLLEEGVRLANACNELIDQTSWRTVEGDPGEDASPAQVASGETVGDDAASGDEALAGDDVPAGDDAGGEPAPAAAGFDAPGGSVGEGADADAAPVDVPSADRLEPPIDDERS